MMGYIANNVEVFEQLGRATVLSRDLLPNFSSHSSITKKANILFLKRNPPRFEIGGRLWILKIHLKNKTSAYQ